jgi:hypothetical protein
VTSSPTSEHWKIRIIWKTKKTTGKRKKQLENEKNNWKTKKTTGKRKKQLDNPENPGSGLSLSAV